MLLFITCRRFFDSLFSLIILARICDAPRWQFEDGCEAARLLTCLPLKELLVRHAPGQLQLIWLAFPAFVLLVGRSQDTIFELIHIGLLVWRNCLINPRTEERSITDSFLLGFKLRIELHSALVLARHSQILVHPKDWPTFVLTDNKRWVFVIFIAHSSLRSVLRQVFVNVYISLVDVANHILPISRKINHEVLLLDFELSAF